jgi:hypothetical protein
MSATAVEGPRRRELAQLVTDHVLGREHRDELPPVVHGERQPEHLGDDRRAARPGLEDLLGLQPLHLDHLLPQVGVDERAFLD